MNDAADYSDDWPEAVYTPQAVPAYQGNPFIEALPPVVDDDGAIDGMQNLVTATDAERALPSVHRMHVLAGVTRFMQPLDYHVDLFHRVSILLRQGYVERDPTSPKFMRDLTEAAAELTRLAKEGSNPAHGKVKAGTRQRIGAGSSLTLLGTSGVGKSTAVEAILRCYAQVICHAEIKGPLAAVYQLVWLKLSVPQDGGIKGLCIDFFEAVDEVLGTGYVRLFANSSVDKLIVVMGRVAFLHGLGMLVIDELQNLNAAKSGGPEKMMNTFKLLRDVVKIPIVCIGTHEAVAILSEDLQTARRNSGLQPMERMKDDPQFTLFCDSLFSAQFLREPLALTPEIVTRLHWLSQGIADVVVKLFVSAQTKALSTGMETMTQAMFDDAYDREMGLLHPFLEKLRKQEHVDGPSFDQALLATRALKAPPAAAKVAAQPPEPKPSVEGVKAKRPRRAKGEESSCLLVRVVEDGLRQQVTPHQALLDAGFIRPLGLEALGG